MPYLFLEDVAIADVAFEAWEDTREALFVAVAEATMNVMVGDLDTIVKRTLRSVQVASEALDLLLFNFLQAIIFHKDAQRRLLRAERSGSKGAERVSRHLPNCRARCWIRIAMIWWWM